MGIMSAKIVNIIGKILKDWGKTSLTLPINSKGQYAFLALRRTSRVLAMGGFKAPKPHRSTKLVNAQK
jgi:hypothetical protein